MTPEQSMLNATLTGYVSGLAWCAYTDGPGRNPYIWIQPEADAWQRGFEQGRDRFMDLSVLAAPGKNGYASVKYAPIDELVCVMWGTPYHGENGVAKYAHGKWWDYTSANPHARGRECAPPTWWTKKTW